MCGVCVNLNNYKIGNIIKIYFQSKNNLVNGLLEKKCILIEVLLFIMKIYSVFGKIRNFWIKIIEYTSKFMTTKRLMVYHTINNQIIWSNKPVILWIPNPNRNYFDVIISPLLTPCTKSVAYNSTTFVIFSLLESLFPLFLF